MLLFRERLCVLTEKEHGILVRTVTANHHYINAFYKAVQVICFVQVYIIKQHSPETAAVVVIPSPHVFKIFFYLCIFPSFVLISILFIVFSFFS